MNIMRLFDFLDYQLENFPREDSLVSKKNGRWIKTSTQSFANQANQLSRGLLKLGVKKNENAAIITTTNRTEWNIVDIGLQQIGAVSVPLYPTLAPKDYAYILNHAEISICFVSDIGLYNKLVQIKDQVKTLRAIYTFDEIDNVPNYLEISEMGKDESAQAEVDNIKKSINTDDVATIIYTSGTTGTPKGVVLSHRNIADNALFSMERVPDFGTDNPIALSFLPINHVFERMLIYLYINKGIGIYYAESIEKLGDNLKEIQPHVMTVVPRLVEKVYAKIYDTGANAGGLKSKIFLWSLNLIENYEPYADKGFFWNLKHKIASAIVFKKWREGVGGRLVCMVSGSAALSQRLNRLFWGAGIPILEGYGLTETSPVVSVNEMSKDGFGIGTVGRPIGNAEVKFAEDGEILVKGSSVFKEYYKDPEKTKEAFTEDGYFKTGDIGVMENGLLKITDRKKEIFKTSGGKYIAPQVIENTFKQSRFIEQIMVVGEGEKMPCAFIQPNFVNLEAWAKENNIPNGTNEKLIEASQTKELFEKEIDVLNTQLGNWEKIKKFELIPNEWSIDGGELTPTLKLKRKVIKSKYQHLYDKLYSDN